LAGATGDSTPWILLKRSTSTQTVWYLNGADRITQTVNDDNYTHLALTYDGSVWRAYKNGVADGTYTGGVGSNAGERLILGNGYNGYYGGAIDEVLFFNRTFFPDEIKALYDSRVNKFNGTLRYILPGTHNYTIYSVDTQGERSNTSVRTFNAGYSLSGCNDNLNIPNRIYFLNTSVTDVDSCFEIWESNITIDCNNYSVTYGTSASSAGNYGVYFGETGNYVNSSVRNCIIYYGSSYDDWNPAIDLLQDNASLINNTIYSSVSIGVWVISKYSLIANNTVLSNGDYGFGIESLNYSRFINNSGTSEEAVSDNPGIYFMNSYWNNISNSTGIGENGAGFEMYHSSYNNLQDIKGISDTAAGIEMWENNYNNTFRNVNATSTSYYGLYINYGSRDNTFYNTTVYSGSSTGLFLFRDARNNSFYNLTARTDGSSTVAIQFYGSGNMTFKDCAAIAPNYEYSVYMDNSGSAYGSVTNNTFTNCTFTGSEVLDSSTQLIRKWYYDAYTNDTLGLYVPSVNVTGANRTGTRQFSVLSNGTGWIARQEIIDYVNNGGSKYYASNYSINGTYSSAVIAKSHNITVENNVLDVFTFNTSSFCRTISAPNIVYNLTQNVSTTSTCFTVTASNVTIDCKGFSIKGNNNSGSIGVYSNVPYTAVVNCTILNFSTGIYFNSSANNGLINNVTINQTYATSCSDSTGVCAAMFGKGSANLSITKLYADKTLSMAENASNLLITSSNIYDISIYPGISYAMLNVSIINTTVTYINPFRANNSYMSSVNISYIYLESMSNLTMTNIRLTGEFETDNANNLYIYNSTLNQTGTTSSSYAIYAYNGDNISIADSNITSASYGITTYGPSLSLRNVSLISKNTSLDVYAACGSSSRNISVSNNYFNSNASSVIYIQQCISNSTFVNNTFVSGTGTGVLLNISFTSGNNTFYRNNFTQTSGYYIFNGNNTNRFNTSVGTVAQGNYYYDISTKNIFDANSDGWGDSGSDYPLNTSTWPTKWMGNGTDYGPAVTAVSCSVLSAAGTTYNLSSNATSSGTCFNVTAANITIDCKGYTITGNNATGTFGVYSNSYNTTVKNCIIRNFSTGIYYIGVINGTIFNNSISTEHVESGDNGKGIYIYASSNYNKIIDTNANATPYGAGVYISYSSNNTIINTTGVSNSTWGIYLIYSPNNTISNSRGISNETGIYVCVGSDYNIIKYSNGTSTGGYMGIRIDSSYASLISVIGTSVSGTGVMLGSSIHNNTLWNSSGTATSGHGLGVYSNNHSIINFNATSSGNYGIYVTGAYNIITAARAISSGSVGILFQGGINNRVLNSTLQSSTSSGVFLWTGSNNNTILYSNVSGSTVSGSGGLAIGTNSQNNTIANSTINGLATLYAVLISGTCSGNVFINNTFKNATSTLLDIDLTSGNNRFYWNNFTNASGYYINNRNNTNTFNTSVTGVAQGNYYDNISTKNVFDSNSNGWGDTGADYPINVSTWATKWTGNGTDYGPATTRTLFVTVTYQSPTPADNSRQTANSVTINVSVSAGMNVSNCTLQWNGTTNYSMTKVGTGISVYCYRTMTTVDGGIYTYKVYANDSLGTLDNSSTRNFTENTPPSVTATITPVSPTTLDNLTCTVGGWIDPQDAPGNYTFQWYNGTTFKFSSGLTTSTTYTLLSTNLSIGDTWNCTITPWDGFENGTAVSTNKYINMPCMTLSTANAIYNMTSNLSSTGTCFNVTARNVTLDCRWNWINFSTGGSGSTYGVYSNQNYTTIKNCRIIDGNWATGLNTRHGIYLSGSNYSYLLNNFINTSNGSAIYLYSSANYNNITNNTGLSYSTYAINIRSSSNNVLVSNNGTSTINMGLAVWSTANNNYLYNNTGVGLGGSGGLYIGVSSNNTLISNRGICTDYIGIIVEDSSNCFLDSNTGISQAGSNRGLYIGISANITVVNQTATGSRGIQLTSANNTIIKDCVSFNGTTYDVHVDATSLNNSFINCSYNTTEEYVESGSQLIRKWYFDALVTNLTNSPLVNSNLTIYNRTSSAVYSNLTNSTGHIYRAEVIDYTNVGGTRVYQTNHTVNVTKLGYYPNSTTYNVTNYTNIFATIKLNKNPLELIDCWTLSASGETYNLSMNVNSSGTCFTVTGQNIVLDCLGYSINYSTGGAAYTYGVYSDQYNTTIRNCTIIDGNTTSSNNNRYGIIFESNDFSVIYNNFVNTSNSDAMWIYNGANFNNISRNRVYSSSGSGIVLHSSLSNKLIDNNATSASGSGVYLVSYSNNNTLLRNFANTTGSNPAIYIYSSSYNNLTQNKGVSTSSNGINIDEHSDNNTLYSNNGTSLGTESAITLSNSVNNSLINNSGNNLAGGIGILVAYSANNNTLINSTGTSTSGQGVYLFLSYGNNFINQTATGAHGIYVQTSNNTVFRDCGNIAGNSGQDVYYNSAAGSVNNTFINCSYTLSDETVQGSANQLIKKWYYQAYANYTNNTAVPNANITGANRTGSIQFSVLTNSTGWITRQEIIDYVNIGGTRTYYSNYSINGTKSSNAVNHSLNISTLTNMIDNFTFPANSAPSKVTLIYPGDGNGSFIERTPTFSWNAATDPDGNPITYILNVSNSSSFATSTYIKTGISSTSQLYDAGELPFVTGYTPYYWKVRATDGTLEGEWSDTWNFTLVTSVNIVLLVDNVTFPAMNPNVSNSTNATGGPTPLLLKSTSNTYVKISQMNVSGSLWSTQSLNTSYWQMRVTPKSDGSFNSSSLTSYFNVTNVTNLIRYMNYSATRNNASIDINVTVPLYEPPGQKSSSIVFLAQVDT